ncbi:MAG: methyltransferase domain-containing protein [Acidobacteriota bacterium]
MNDDGADFHNVYADRVRARAYADLAFPGSYYLAFRDLPRLFEEHVPGRRALDFGCGAGRSSRFLRELGFQVTGVDIAPEMLEHARAADPAGDYRLVPEGDFSTLEPAAYDLAFSAFTFDNVAGNESRLGLLLGLRGCLARHGRIVNLASAEDIYLHEWLSFSTKDFPENHTARSGDEVRIVMLDVDDRRPVRDTLCTDEDYRKLYDRAGLELLETHRPLGTADDPHEWVTETSVSPWAIYVLRAGA